MLYNTLSLVRPDDKLPTSSKLSEGTDLTICSLSHASMESQRACDVVEEMGIKCDHFSIANLKDWGLNRIFESAMRSGKVLIVDNGWLNCSIAHTVGYRLFEMGFRGKVTAVGYEDMPCPTARIGK